MTRDQKQNARLSTGGLIAPFAFLGSAYDQKLKEIFTSFSTKDLVSLRSKRNIILNDSAADTAPLRAKIAEYVDEEMMRAIAAEHRLGRSMRPVLHRDRHGLTPEFL